MPSTSSSPAPTDPSGPLSARLDRLPEDVRRRVLTHAAWAARPGDSNERYEFLGDGVLDLALGEWLFARFPEAQPGELSRVKNQLRSDRFCAIVARMEDLGLLIAASGAAQGAAERAAVIARSPSALADVAEAVLGATYLELGWDEARAAAVEAFAPLVDRALDPRRDPKSALQEAVQRQGRSVRYETVEITGPPHQQVFRIALLLDGDVVAHGEGASRRAAEQRAARRALPALGADR